MSTTTYKRKAGLNATAYSWFIHALMTAPRSKTELEEITGMGHALSGRCIKALRDRKLLAVVGWRLDARGRMTVREYRLLDKPQNPLPDVPCPRMDRKEIERRYAAKKKGKTT